MPDQSWEFSTDLVETTMVIEADCNVPFRRKPATSRLREIPTRHLGLHACSADPLRKSGELRSSRRRRRSQAFCGGAEHRLSAGEVDGDPCLRCSTSGRPPFCARRRQRAMPHIAAPSAGHAGGAKVVTTTTTADHGQRCLAALVRGPRRLRESRGPTSASPRRLRTQQVLARKSLDCHAHRR